MSRFFLLTIIYLISSCVGNNKKILPKSDIADGRRIEYFYTDFYANHNDEKLFEPDFWREYAGQSVNEGLKIIDSLTFENIINRLCSFRDKNSNKNSNFFNVYYQLKFIDRDTVKRIVVLNGDNYFSINGRDFIKDDTLAFQLKKVMGVYERYPLDKRREVFKEARLFNLDTIPSKISDDENMLYYRGWLVSKGNKADH
ncbi:hypothetical protein FAZ19_22425 [Sphingobacterium alkalisoli]|uniref:Uncharacterized protein n=1 Tax=Sphingobacterium alkalisoli TaxID=1874115 RepID=A0A4U0GPH3_9SPHI|nr:hypothetical protein [Sphingobacterium alkalisoli]TJY60698.1 hypothetical protein FAZ19_22425 [Sphingobacterium alkalisoli]GGH31404.1 hypothetical protein GCM10011418_44170 [Sphingobacterium alkalisoli]